MSVFLQPGAFFCASALLGCPEMTCDKELSRDEEQNDLPLCYAKKAVELEPHTMTYRAYYGTLLLKRKRYHELTTVLQEGLFLCPNWAEGLYIWARLLRKQGDWQGALEKSREALRLSPTIMKYRNQLVRLLLHNRKYLEAISVACSHPRKKFAAIAFILINGKWSRKK